LIDLAGSLTSRSAPVVVHALEEERDQLSTLVRDAHQAPVIFVAGPPRDDTAVLRTDRLYHEGRLKKSMRRGGSPETAVLWRLDRPESLEVASQELTRRLNYQPLGRYWAFPLAEKLVDTLRPTAIRPNAVTLAATGLMLVAAAMIASGATGWPGRAAVASAMAIALVLDTADGRLARLQGTSSALGRWLDQVCDELADMALHAAIAWSAFCESGMVIWLVLGILYASGKHLFLIQSLRGDELDAGESRVPLDTGRHGCSRSARRRSSDWLAAALRIPGHADVRWHLWIVLALAGRLELALAAYAAYYPARASFGAIRKAVRHA
jgi:phosphatidylglycerophosphate synthase